MSCGLRCGDRTLVSFGVSCLTPTSVSHQACASKKSPISAPDKASVERWLGESEQSDKWFPCLITALLPHSRREHVETITAQP